MSFFQKIRNNKANESEKKVDFNYFVFDVETTGLNPSKDEILEIAFVKLDSEVNEIDRFSTLLKPKGKVKGTEVHGITEQDIFAAPTFEEIFPKIISELDKSILVAHNSKFDINFLRSEFLRLGIELPELPSLCTLEISKSFLRKNERFRLIDCCHAVGIELKDSHTAFGDVEATAQLFRFFIKNGVSIEIDDSDFPLFSKLNIGSMGISPEFNPIQRHSKKLDNPKNSKSGFYLIDLLTQMPSHYALGDIPSRGSLEYFEKLMEIFEDGVITVEEGLELGELANMFQIGQELREALHLQILTGIVKIAFQDGTLETLEKQELTQISNLLDISKSNLNFILKTEKSKAQVTKAGEVLSLPQDWGLGEPLRIGDKIAFTGCDPTWRAKAEILTTNKGLQLMGNVSSKTKLLVTDGSYSGNKLASAREHGVRIATPEEFEELVRFVQLPSP